MIKEIIAVYKADNLKDAIFTTNRVTKPLSEVESWDNVDFLACPHCLTYARLREECCEELCIPQSPSYFCTGEDENGFVEYCYDCGERVLYPPMRKFRGALKCKSFELGVA